MMEVRPLRSGADYDAALEAIEAFFETERNPALPRPIVSIRLRSSSPITSASIGP
jgi:antitoxin component HigA of HigAB toxin-antitoxin module